MGMGVVWMVFAALCWGGTNPLLKDGVQGFDRVHGSLWQRLLFLARRWRFVVPFGVNQCGSVFFAMSIASSPLGAAATVVNALTFLFTAIVDAILGHRLLLSWRLVAGTALVLFGAHLTLTAAPT
ncbi:hypothetical protein PTSG_06204 [Salpingoeca rosetta]|uniref:Transmembrane protein n=1 Tax=Salpingoeca rosetta (strain ATCC 50818 / BSB-021) TaxID=946362 RepID=F2UC87_SALR5|nr:uncharacterized protein PTSG_06204 [Salpingoeca rosetta]EGD74194.1 hypothetical protein PTSG_06204 [Salpingoeca rosetta]|eukprot:XP_004993094.1 hypothetical protein PTSG_06204 [Salpingoeca rosetta]